MTKLGVPEYTDKLSAVDADGTHLLELQRFAGLGRLSASLLHEISNPLSSALLYLEQAGEGNLRQAKRSLHTLRRYVEAARQQVRHNDTAVSFCLKPQIDQVKRVVAPLARSAGVQLYIEAPPHFQLRGDPVKFQQILANLVANAVEAYRHAPKQTSAKPVQVIFAGTAKAVTIKVIDWGEGITTDQLPRLFEPFYTTKTDQSGHGLGIGLAIVRQYAVESFGGSIRVSSSRRYGTRFVVHLPASPPGDSHFRK